MIFNKVYNYHFQLHNELLIELMEAQGCGINTIQQISYILYDVTKMVGLNIPCEYVLYLPSV